MLPGSRLYLDARLLGLRRFWLLLGPWRLGLPTADRFSLDARLLGLFAVAATSSTMATGVRQSAFTAGSIMATAYIGHGYYGGQWSGGVFRYNTAVSRVDTAVIHNTYVNREVVNQNVGSRAGFNGPGGAKAKPYEAGTSRREGRACPGHLRAAGPG